MVEDEAAVQAGTQATLEGDFRVRFVAALGPLLTPEIRCLIALGQFSKEGTSKADITESQLPNSVKEMIWER
jgi:hypothetical protein